MLLPLVLVLGVVLAWFPKDGVIAPSPSPSANSAASPTAPSATLLETSPAPRAQARVITLEIRGPAGTTTYQFPTQTESTVADLLLRASKEQGLRMETKDYGGSLGIFVEALNDVRNDSKKKLYWSLYVNETLSQLGASSTRVRPGDTVTWTYEPMREEER
ncbi:MAG: DUF4430 domain-containing protein [bacterium]|nr:DUF4430 domain-containing protein [bacterium]